MPHNQGHAQGQVFEEEDFEDVDEDDMSDSDSEELQLSYEQFRKSIRHPDVTSQLLNFADSVSGDIRKFFGRAKDQDDSCDVYEDKWKTMKSGRELYYMDLLRIAQGDSDPSSKRNREKDNNSSVSSPSSSSLSPREDLDNRSKFSGKRDDNVGMGGLADLFDFGLKHFLHDKKQKPSAKSRISTLNMTPPSNVTPMSDRKFPDSFWREPEPPVSAGAQMMESHLSQLHPSIDQGHPSIDQGLPPIDQGHPLSKVHTTGGQNHSIIHNQNSTQDRSISQCHSVSQGHPMVDRCDQSQHGVLSTSKLPDFSDLVESWQGGVEPMEGVTHDKVSRVDHDLSHNNTFNTLATTLLNIHDHHRL